MCGIAGIHRRNGRPVKKIGTLADELLLQIETRGRDATGYLAMLDTGRGQIDKRAVAAHDFVLRRDRFASDVRTLLLHTRWATIGAKVQENAHPVVSGRCAAIHNGTIYNHHEVFASLDRQRNASVDSEVIPAVIDHYGWEQAAKALAKLDGGMATAVVSAEHPHELILARTTGYPLVFMVTRDVIVWASTRAAIERAWLLTYLRPVPEKAAWTDMRNFSLARINGKVELEKIPDLLHRGWFTRSKTGFTGYAGKGKAKPDPKQGIASGKATGKRAQRRTRKRRNQLSLPTGTAKVVLPESRIVVPLGAGSYEPPEPWLEDMVLTLMRVEGMSRQDAEELCFGFSRDDIEDLIS